MTLKVDQGHWRWHNSISQMVCSNSVSDLFCMDDFNLVKLWWGTEDT